MKKHIFCWFGALMIIAPIQPAFAEGNNVPIDPETKCALSGNEFAWDADGTISSGTGVSIVCNGRNIGLESDQIVEGILRTSDFGQWIMKITGGGTGFEIFLPPEEAARVLKFATE